MAHASPGAGVRLPTGQEYPAVALHGPLHALVIKPTVAPNVPAGHAACAQESTRSKLRILILIQLFTRHHQRGELQ
jgi:hypothetical protein